MKLVENHTDRIVIKTKHLCDGQGVQSTKCIENLNFPYVAHIDSAGSMVENIL